MLTSPDILTRSDAIAALRDFIEAGRYAPGDRLPPERELMGSLNMSRTILRKALDALEREGAIWRHVGKGTFISGSVSAAQPGLVADISQQLTPVKMMRARLSIEPAIAREAAVNASPGAIQRIRDAVERATGTRPPLPTRVGDLFAREERFVELPGDYDAVKAYILETAA